MVFVSPAGERFEAKGRVGQNVLDVAIENDVNIEGAPLPPRLLVAASMAHPPRGVAGACGGTLACSTCHVVVDEKSFAKLDPPEEEELDMLDLAFGLTDRYTIIRLGGRTRGACI